MAQPGNDSLGIPNRSNRREPTLDIVACSPRVVAGGADERAEQSSGSLAVLANPRFRLADDRVGKFPSDASQRPAT